MPCVSVVLALGCARPACPPPISVATAEPDPSSAQPEGEPGVGVVGPDARLPSGKTPADPRSFEVRDASKLYDFRITLDAKCETAVPPDAECARAGSIDVTPKGAAKPLQSLTQPEVWVQLDDAGKLLVNAAGMYDYQGTINVGDFNFDGEEDFAVQANQEGPYGGPTFDVYLFNAAKQQFDAAPELSRLTREHLGFFGVDEARKRLIARSKSGCCYHERQEFEINGDQTLLVERVVEDGTGGAQLVITEERLVNGKWQRKTRTAPLPN